MEMEGRMNECWNLQLGWLSPVFCVHPLPRKCLVQEPDEQKYFIYGQKYWNT